VLQRNEYKKGVDNYFPREPLLRYMREAGEVGVRSMALIGESEPLLNPNVYDAILTGKKYGVDIGLGTNGILFDKGHAGEEALEHLTFIRFNISAASEESYRRLHGSTEYNVFLEKVRFVLDVKRRKNLPLTVGFQMVLTPQDVNEAVPLARMGKELGVDYFQIKQCADTQDNSLGFYDRLKDYMNFEEILKEAETYSSDDYSVVVKWNYIKSAGARKFNKCLGAPFLLYSSGDGKLYSCGMFFNYREEELQLGDLTKHGFKEIIESERYKGIIKNIPSLIDVEKECYAACRTNSINEYLWMLKNPPDHVNFV
jgi:MoaA/NifB/PqqE/SkfB family radical SAM enzyme